MPDLPFNVNATITRIDAPFPEQWRDEFYQFGKEIAAIKESLSALSVSQTAQAQATSKMAELYTNEALAERASRAVAEERSQQRPFTESGDLPGASRPLPFHSPEPSPGSPGRYRQEQEEQNPSRPPNEEYILDKPIEMPQHYGGKYTAQDMLKLMGKGTRAAGEKLGSEGLMGASRTFAKVAEGQPTASAILNLGKTYGGAARGWSEGLSQYSGSLGYEPGGGFLGSNNLNIGPANFRVPLLNSAALSGIEQTAGAYGTAMTVPGLSGSQVMAMQQSLAERGWFPGQKGQQELFDSQAHLIGKGGAFQQLGEDPEVANLMDRAMRSGTAGSDEMIRSIEEIPEAAKHAHEGMSQMVADMNEYGEFSQSTGGTHYAGQQQALQLSNMTGLPTSALKGLMESPWTQSAIFRSTGEPSWMQGTVPGAIKNQAMLQGFWSLAGAVGKGTGKTYSKDGFQVKVSPIEEQAARMHMLMPNTNPETIQRMLREGKIGTKGRGEVQQMAEAWEKNGQAFVGKDGTARQRDRANAYLRAEMGNGANFGKLLKEMAGVHTADGSRMFSPEDIKEIRTNKGAGYSSHGKKLLEEKYQAVQEILGTKAGKDSNAAGSPGQEVTIELSQQARRFLQLPNKQSRYKLEAGAGENQTNHAYTGSTDPLMPTVAAAQNGYYGGGR